jgi:hypothetical protein
MKRISQKGRFKASKGYTYSFEGLFFLALHRKTNLSKSNNKMKEEDFMKKMILLSFFVIFIPVILYGQDKIEAPVWSIGDRWSFAGNFPMSVINADENTYTVKFLTRTGESIYIYDKSSLNILYSVEGDRRIEFKGVHKRRLNFPFEIGKSWKDSFRRKTIHQTAAAREYVYYDTYRVSGWEDIEVRGGKYKALKIEHKEERVEDQARQQTKEGKAWFWYSPDVKYLIKCKLEESPFWIGYNDWELTSFKLK